MMNLTEKELQLLALVASEELAGREVAQRFKKETGKEVSYGTLYTTFRRLKDEKLVTVRDAEDEDGRIRFFKATASGLRALHRTREHYSLLARFGLSWGGAV